MDTIKLGDTVKSKVSGFAGTVTAKCEHLYNATLYLVTANELVCGEEKSMCFTVAELIPTE